MNILLSGITGSMGQVIKDLVGETQGDFNIVAGFADIEDRGFNPPIYNDLGLVKEEVDLVLDFSSPNVLDSLLDYCIKNNKPIVIATTGYTDEQINMIREAGEKIPVLFSRNMSLGVNVLLNIVKNLASVLDGFDIEIVETHHKLKKDSPSGTALMLYDAANEGRDKKLFKNLGRQGLDLERPEEEVGIHALRGGSVVGDHSVNFYGLDEIIEVKHRANSKKIFAQGALKACRFLIDKEVGLYSMEDLFNF